MKRKLLLLFCMSLLFLTAAGCSQPVRPAQVVKDDLFDNPSFYSHSAPDAVVTNFRITKRWQVPKTKTEHVQAAVSVEGSGGSGELAYLMTYVLQNEGWVLSEVVPDPDVQWVFFPNHITNDQATALLQKKFGDSYNIVQQEESDKLTCIFSYAKASNTPFMSQDVTGTMTFTFDTATALWSEPVFAETAGAELWTVAGDWSFVAEIPYYVTDDTTVYNFNMKITSFDGKTCAASYTMVEEFRNNGVIYSKSESSVFPSILEDSFYYEIENLNGKVYSFSIDKDKGVVVRFPDASGPCKFTP